MYGSYRLYKMNLDGTGRTLIPIQTTGNITAPAVSPDGRRILYTLRDDIWVANADGSGETNLTNTTAFERTPAWSPDGHTIAFASNRGGTYDIYLMNPDGTGVMNLTQDAAGDDLSPAWSPDGQNLAFTSHRDGDAEIYTMDRSGGAATNITNDPAQDYDPAWAPDGARLVFGSTRGAGGNRLFLMQADGSALGELPIPGANTGGPNWGAKGYLVFQCVDTASDICLIRPDSTGLVNLTMDLSYEFDPAWSP